MFRKVNGGFSLTAWRVALRTKAKERPIGFYHTGPRLRSSDLEITELFKRFCPRPVMVIVDVRAKGGRGETGIPTDAYFAVEEIRDVSSRSIRPGSSFRGRSSLWTRIDLVRTAHPPNAPLPTFPPLLKPKKPKRLASSIFFATLPLLPPPHPPPS